MIKIEYSGTQGCDICFQSAYSDKKMLKYICHSDVYDTYLYRCPKCGSYWEFNANDVNIIDKSKVKESYNIKVKYKLNKYVKLLLVLIYIVIFYYAWAKSEIFGVIVTIATFYITILDKK